MTTKQKSLRVAVTAALTSAGMAYAIGYFDSKSSKHWYIPPTIGVLITVAVLTLMTAVVALCVYFDV